MEIIFHSHANKTHFHKKGCAPSLILKVSVFGSRRWPIIEFSFGKSPIMALAFGQVLLFNSAVLLPPLLSLQRLFNDLFNLVPRTFCFVSESELRQHDFSFPI